MYLFRRNFGSIINRLAQCRFLSTSKNYYEALEITPKATQLEIKAAYFKLSKLYHPDLNKDDVKSTSKFREIAEAYEVLGNVNSRKKYDQSLVDEKAFGGWNSAQEFGRRTTRGPPPTGRTRYYDYDEWTNRHYESMFRKREEFFRQQREMIRRRNKDNKEHILFLRWMSFTMLITSLVFFAEMQFRESKSRPREGSQRK